MLKYFKIEEYGSTLKTEIVAGFTTFFAMAYVIFVNPAILSIAGMPQDGVFIATILAAAAGCLFMGLIANVPFAQASGMGLNAFFAFTVCGAMGFVWQEALAMVFICGAINILLTLTSIRKQLFIAIPAFLKKGIGVAIGLFIVYLGMKNAGFFTFTTDPGHYMDLGGTIVSDSSVIPALVDFSNPRPILALIGLIITSILFIKKMPGAIFIGILATTIIGVPMGIVDFSNISAVSLDHMQALNDVSLSFFGDPGFLSMFNSPHRVVLSIIAIFAFSLSDVFDSLGTFMAAGSIGGLFTEEDEINLQNSKGFNTRFEKALLSDMLATALGALLGTSNVTTYVESAAGIGAGGRTGLVSVITSLLFLLCLPFASLLGCVPPEATCSALIIVGVLMMADTADIKWSDIDEALPVLMTIAVMVLAFNISYGIAAGFIFYCIVKLVKHEQKQITPVLAGATILFLINFVIQAVI